MSNEIVKPLEAAEGMGQAPDNRIHPALLLFLLIPVAGLVAALIIGSNRSAATTPNEPPAITSIPFTLIDNPAPQFTLNTLDGDPIKLTDLQGKWVFLNFWATWCPPCVTEMPELQKLYDGGYGTDPQAITVLTVDKSEDEATVRKFMTDNKLTLPVALDTDSVVNGQYVVINLPITFMIDPQGVVRYQHLSPLTPEVINLFLEKIRNGESS
ncbi:MAG: TlpA family protein disulfide reductase [Anaerolineae bacterium]|nr:TlpA family protein disulfide reductase [Anaerolineae bacterium]